MKTWNAFLDKYYPEANRADANVIYGYAVAQTMVHVLKQCGNDLTRANVMKQAASMQDYHRRRPVAGREDQHQRHGFCSGFADCS